MAEENHWQLIAVEDFQRPTLASSTRLHLWWRRLLRTLGVNRAASTQTNTDELPDYQGFDRTPAVAVLTEALAAWREEEAVEVNFLLAPPFSGTKAIAKEWAAQQAVVILKPPTLVQIQQLSLDEWWQAQATEGRPWLITELGHYWLRSIDGLNFIRALLPLLLKGDFGKGLVVCNSWSFTFLRHLWPLTLPRVYCFAPVNGALLAQLGIEGKPRQRERLAGQARGNVGVALALWSTSDQEDDARPSLPLTANDSSAFILYALLVHGGLSGAVLQQVLPTLSADELQLWLLHLAELGLVECVAERWQVSVHGYLAVREFLDGRGYVLDDF